MPQHQTRDSWIDQFVLPAPGPGSLLAPFSQVIAAADLLKLAASNRSGLTRANFERAGTARYQVTVLADFTRDLDEDCAARLLSADEAQSLPGGDEAERSVRARAMMRSLTGAIEATSTLVEISQALIGVAEELLVTAGPGRRVELVAAVEALRTAAYTAAVSVEMNLFRITDAVKYDRLAARLTALDEILARADVVTRGVRARIAVQASGVPTQRSLFSG